MAVQSELNLPENLTITQAHALHDEIETLMASELSEEVVVNAGNVVRADTAGLQLLLVLVQTSKERQADVVWKSPSEKFIEVARTLGLTAALGLH